MREIISNFPKQFKVGLQASPKFKSKKLPKGLCICGMGGSALPGSILAGWINEKRINLPIIISRDYSLPHIVDKNWLVFCISYSGNTEETISCFKEAQKRKIKIVAIGSNGKLEKLSKKFNAPFAKIPSGIPPRTAIGYQFGALIGALKNLGVISLKEVKEVLSLEKINVLALENQGRQFAKNLKGKIPVIYASNRLKIAARIWKINFNENTKIPAFWNYFPELNHNEMTGFENFKLKNLGCKFYFIILKDKNDHPRIKKRMELTSKILKKQGLEGKIIEIKGKSYLEKVFNSIILALWTSYYLAKIYKTDPTSVKLVEEFKKKL